MRSGYRIFHHPSDDYLDFFSPHSNAMSFDSFKELNDSKQIIDPSTPFFSLGSNPPLFDKLYYSPAMSCKTDLTPYFLLSLPSLPALHAARTRRDFRKDESSCISRGRTPKATKKASIGTSATPGATKPKTGAWSLRHAATCASPCST